MYCDSFASTSIPSSIWKQISDLVFTNQLLLKMIILAVQQQRNAVDCGVFSIAFAVDALFDVCPIGQGYDVAKMRKHLISCLQTGTFTPFPRIEKRQKISKS